MAYGGATSSSRPADERAEEKRERILRAARALAEREGVSAARMEEARGGDDARLGRYERMRMELGRAAKEASKVDYASMFNPR